MARLPYLDKDDLPPADHDVLKRTINLYRLLAHNPAAARRFQGLGAYIRHDSQLDPRLRELAILQVGYLARADYEWSHHVKIGYDFGVSPDDIRALIAETEGRESDLEPMAKTVLRAAREMTLEGAASDATMSVLQSELALAEQIDLVMTIAFYNAVVRFLATMRIDVEENYMRYLDEFPLPEEPA